LSEGASRAEILILLGSARSDGDTAKAAAALLAGLACPRSSLVDLHAKRIQPFDYAGPRLDDDFSAIADLMITYRTIVFATPVYWYAMSGPMKTFFDRLSDLLSDRDPGRRGHRLAGRDAWLLAVGTDRTLPGGFERPFEMTARYLGMRWRGGHYVRSGASLDLAAIGPLIAELTNPPQHCR
jgi:putative NADPH-quinone reductase